jgi:hypothetical protein
VIFTEVTSTRFISVNASIAINCPNSKKSATLKAFSILDSLSASPGTFTFFQKSFLTSSISLIASANPEEFFPYLLIPHNVS